MPTEKKAGASIIFLNSSGKVLLLLRDDKQEIPFPNCWDLLGGHLEEGETARQCIEREMQEEIEVVLENPPLFRRYDMDDRVEHCFWQRADFDIASLILHEGQRLKWFSEADIQRLADVEVAYNFKGVLLDFFRERPWQSA
jgi:8-oxo-dGTP diphosphatase